MPIGYFSTLKWGDEQQLKDWLAQHDADHRTYGSASAPAEQVDFSTVPDSDWFFRHLTEHQRLSDLTGSAPSVTPTMTVDTQKWYGPEDYHWWHFHHNRLHAALDSYFGL